jgi:hypothetical protein
MKSRLDKIPVFETRQCEIGAEHFNLVQVALKRLGSPLRLELPKLRTLDLFLDNEAWVVVDRALNDIPVLAWVEFDTRGRADISQPIPCQRRSYHTHALVIMDKVLEAMHLLLGERLHAQRAESENVVVTLGARK